MRHEIKEKLPYISRKKKIKKNFKKVLRFKKKNLSLHYQINKPLKKQKNEKFINRYRTRYFICSYNRYGFLFNHFQYNCVEYRRNNVGKQKGRIKLRPYLKKIFKKTTKNF